MTFLVAVGVFLLLCTAIILQAVAELLKSIDRKMTQQTGYLHELSKRLPSDGNRSL